MDGNGHGCVRNIETSPFRKVDGRVVPQSKKAFRSLARADGTGCLVDFKFHSTRAGGRADTKESRERASTVGDTR